MRDINTNQPDFDVIANTEERGKPRWRSLGAAWKLKDKDGFSIVLNLVPTNWDGRCILMPPRELEQEDQR